MRILIFLACLITPSFTAAIELIAHRGNSCGAPENTLEGIQNSWAIGVDAVELDVRVSRDFIAYLFHDKKINSTPVQGKTYQELITHSPKVQIFTLVEALMIDPNGGYYILDLKDVITQDIDALVDAITESKIPESKLAFQSNNIELLSTIHRYYTSSRYFYLERLNRRLPLLLKPNPQFIIKPLQGSDIDGVSFKGRRFLDEAYLEKFKKIDLDIYVWTINDPERALHYEKIGVNGIITDNFSEIRERVTTKPFAMVNCD